MRLWSLDPKYLDRAGLLACWREGLLAKKVLEGNTIGYKNHPQLYRFKNLENPLDGINAYLTIIYNEAINRNYKFSASKIEIIHKIGIIEVNDGQVEFEKKHLLKKLEIRDLKRFNNLSLVDKVEINPIFKIIALGIETWEKV
ncbi:MAG: pyrimidine dimer DNA glycosylase/endonuclease V [Candidatus Gracilibacteria bacterium]|nr:pyrimidine dimer DNA glycosylase/endonuclease V [Candidatus Gracilibacteria bacterium]MDD2908457.1 pyrimidine dimer DNA glycosylase/endonuclease V [Candidatus Gracilibacteria bacterium]